MNQPSRPDTLHGIAANANRRADELRTDGRTSLTNSVLGFSSTTALTFAEAQASGLKIPQQIWARANQLYRDEQLSHRDVITRLVAEGYPRQLCTFVIRKMTNKRPLPTQITSPLIFFVVALGLLTWGQMHNPADSNVVEGLKLYATVIGMIAMLPALLGLIFQVYDRIPTVQDFLEPILHRRRATKSDIVTLDLSYLAGELNDQDYQSALKTMMGSARGTRHFHANRMNKFFGID
jgi:hypothetical protein